MAFKIKKTKKGVSPIIATIFLVLITLVAVIFISSIVIPWVWEMLSTSKGCFDSYGQLKINMRSSYTCYYNDSSDAKTVNLTIKRGSKPVSIERFRVSISGDGENKVYNVKEGATVDYKMLSGSQIISLPKPGEERTYSFNTSFVNLEEVEIIPILKGGKICDNPSDRQKIGKC